MSAEMKKKKKEKKQIKKMICMGRQDLRTE